MSFNIFFIDFSKEDFATKNAKANMKEKIKKKCGNDINKFKEIKDELIDKYLTKDDKYEYEIDCIKTDNDLKILLEKKESKLHKRNLLKQKLKNKLNEKNKPQMTQKQYLKNEKIQKKQMTQDTRVTQEMISAYNVARNLSQNMKVITPIEILDDKDKFIKEIFQHLLVVMQKSSSTEEIDKLMNHPYINYIQIVCSFNYKQYLDMFKDKLVGAKNNEENKDDNSQDLKNDEEKIKEDKKKTLLQNLKNNIN